MKLGKDKDKKYEMNFIDFNKRQYSPNLDTSNILC